MFVSDTWHVRSAKEIGADRGTDTGTDRHKHISNEPTFSSSSAVSRTSHPYFVSNLPSLSPVSLEFNSQKWSILRTLIDLHCFNIRHLPTHSSGFLATKEVNTDSTRTLSRWILVNLASNFQHFSNRRISAKIPGTFSMCNQTRNHILKHFVIAHFLKCAKSNILHVYQNI